MEIAKAEAESLPPPHRTYEEYKAWQQQLQKASVLSREEVTRRVLAQKATSPSQPMTTERATKMLTLASRNLWGEIIPKLSAEGALEVAEKVADVELRDALVKHSLDAR